MLKITFFCKKYNSQLLMKFEWVVTYRAYYLLQNIMTYEILKEETNTELIASANDSSGIFRPCTHYQDEVLSNTEVEDSSDMQIDSQIAMVKLIVTNQDQQETRHSCDHQ